MKSDRYVSLHTFIAAIKRRGFYETLALLSKVDHGEITQTEFYSLFIANKSYPNAFFRSKARLLQYNLIGYKLNSQNEKVICLMDKGKKVWALIQQIDSIFNLKE